MSKYRTAYAPEFRQQLVELVHAGRSANDVAKEFGLHATTVAKWVRLSPMGAPAAVPPSRNNVSQGPLNAAERQELVELRRKLRQVQMERDILAKACAPGLPAKASGRLQRLPARESKPGQTTCARPVRNAQGLRQRILRLAGSPAEQTGASQRGLARAHPPSPPRQRRDLWHAPYSCRAGRYRRHCQPQANCPPPACDGPPGDSSVVVNPPRRTFLAWLATRCPRLRISSVERVTRTSSVWPTSAWRTL